MSGIQKDLTASVNRAREGGVDVLSSANDPEQRKKFAEICELLLAAGYFRVRIQGLGEFDKVIGGLAWAITASSIFNRAIYAIDYMFTFLNIVRLDFGPDVDVEVDVFFQEEARLGDQIKIGETIIKSLQRMKCPHALQTQQIRGLDFINIFPIVQWLVAKVYETREITGDLIRKYSESQFNHNMKLPSDSEFENRKPDSMTYVSHVLHRYQPTRHLKPSTDLKPKNEDERVQITLLEFGNQYRSSRVLNTKQKQLTPKEIEEIEKQKKAAEAEENRIKGLMGQYAQISVDGTKVASNMVATMMSGEKDNIKDAVAKYGEGMAGGEVKRTPAEQRVFLEERFKRTEEHKRKQIAAQEEKNKVLQAQHDSLMEKVTALRSQLSKVEKFSARLAHEIEKLNALETPQNSESLKRLRSLVFENESLNAQEELFRANCKKEKAALDAEIAGLQRNDPSEDELQRKRDIAEAFAVDEARLKELRLLLAKKNRDLVLVERRIDEIPSRSELQQYQRAFGELYEQVAALLTETRKYFNMYNKLDDSKNFLAKEVGILASILDNYKPALSTPENRTKFIASLESIIAGVTQTVDKKSAQLSTEKKTLDALTEKHIQLVERERVYYKTAKEFEDECKKNEMLQAKLGGAA